MKYEGRRKNLAGLPGSDVQLKSLVMLAFRCALSAGLEARLYGSQDGRRHRGRL